MTRQLFAPRVSADRDRAWLDKNPALEDFMRKVVDTRLRSAEPGDVVGFIQRIMAQIAVGMPKNRAVWRAAVEFFAVDRHAVLLGPFCGEGRRAGRLGHDDCRGGVVRQRGIDRLALGSAATAGDEGLHPR